MSDKKRVVRLYPTVKVKGQSFKNVKKVTVPNQSMTLKEILKRFIRKESLPVNQEGIYEDRMGDLEKLDKMDIVDKMEIVDEIKSDMEKVKTHRQKEAKKKADEEQQKATEAMRQKIIEEQKQNDPLQKKEGSQ